MKIDNIFAITKDDTFDDDSEDAMVMDRADYQLLGMSKPVVSQPVTNRFGQQDKALLFAKSSKLPSERNRSHSPASRFIDERGMQNIQKPCTSIELDESSSERGYTMVTPVIFKKTSTGELKPV